MNRSRNFRVAQANRSLYRQRMQRQNYFNFVRKNRDEKVGTVQKQNALDYKTN